MPVITPLASRHISQVAALHVGHLRTHFTGLPGQRLLCSYYAAVSEGRGAFGYVAEKQERVVGYICGVWAPSTLLSALVKKHWLALLFWGTAQFVIHPRLMTWAMNRFRASSPMSTDVTRGYELRPIVVAPSARGTRVASDLVAVLLADARRRGFQRVHLVTEVDNGAAHAFYRKVGFRSNGTTTGRSGLAFVRYECSAAPSASGN